MTTGRPETDTLPTRRQVIGGACVSAALLSASPALAVIPGPAAIGRQVAREFLGRSDIMMYRVDDVVCVHYAEAAAAYGAAHLGGLTGDKDLVAAAAARHQRILDGQVGNTANHVDANVYGVWPLELFRQTGDAACRDFGLQLADGQWASLRPDGLTAQTRFWIDDVWMIGALQVQAWRATRNPIYIDRAGREVAAYIQQLQQPNGLFHHGPKAPFCWGRGNGWVAAGLAEVISELPTSHPSYPVVRDGYLRMMKALLAYQSPTGQSSAGQSSAGMWRQLVDRADSWPETSSTAMFGFAFMKGIKAGLLRDSAYRKAADRAWQALSTYLTPEGRLSEVCVGTGQSADAQYYLDRPRVTGDLHGQAPLLWFAGARLEVVAK